MRKKTKYLFNMVEVTLAIGILAVGATAAMALFPVGLDRNKSSMGENYISEEASSLLSYIKSETLSSNADWDYFLGSSGLIPSSKELTDDSSDTTGDWSNVSGNIYYIPEYPNGNQGVFGLKVSTNNIESFTGKASIWKGNIGTINSSISTGVFMEISWPVARPYRFRKKNYYYLELFNYNYSP